MRKLTEVVDDVNEYLPVLSEQVQEFRKVNTEFNKLLDDVFDQTRKGLYQVWQKNERLRPALTKDYSLEDILTLDYHRNSRLLPYTIIRQVMMWVLRHELGLCNNRICEILDLDHSTILHGYDVVCGRIDIGDKTICGIINDEAFKESVVKAKELAPTVERLFGSVKETAAEMKRLTNIKY